MNFLHLHGVPGVGKGLERLDVDLHWPGGAAFHGAVEAVVEPSDLSEEVRRRDRSGDIPSKPRTRAAGTHNLLSGRVNDKGRDSVAQLGGQNGDNLQTARRARPRYEADGSESNAATSPRESQRGSSPPRLQEPQQRILRGATFSLNCAGRNRGGLFVAPSHSAFSNAASASFQFLCIAFTIRLKSLRRLAHLSCLRACTYCDGAPSPTGFL